MAAQRGLIAEAVTDNRARFDEAAARVGATSIDTDIVGRRVRLRVAGDELATAFLGALRHRSISPIDGDADLDVVAWDSVEAGVEPDVGALPPAPEQDAARTMVTGDAGFVALQGRPPFAVQGYDGSSGTGFLWVRDADALIRWGERTKPLLEVFHSWLLDSPWQPVHAAAVAPPGSDVGVLVAGPSGAGKSTSALACVRAGWRYAGDDFVVVASDGPARVDNLYCSARLKPDMASRLGTFADAEVGVVHLNGVEKRDLLLGSTLDGRIGGFRIGAVVLPRVTGVDAPTLRQVGPGAALIGIATCTMHFLRAGSETAFDKIGRFVDEVPAFGLDLGGELDAVPDVLASALP